MARARCWKCFGTCSVATATTCHFPPLWAPIGRRWCWTAAGRCCGREYAREGEVRVDAEGDRRRRRQERPHHRALERRGRAREADEDRLQLARGISERTAQDQRRLHEHARRRGGPHGDIRVDGEAVEEVVAARQDQRGAAVRRDRCVGARRQVQRAVDRRAHAARNAEGRQARDGGHRDRSGRDGPGDVGVGLPEHRSRRADVAGHAITGAAPAPRRRW